MLLHALINGILIVYVSLLSTVGNNTCDFLETELCLYRQRKRTITQKPDSFVSECAVKATSAFSIKSSKAHKTGVYLWNMFGVFKTRATIHSTHLSVLAWVCLRNVVKCQVIRVQIQVCKAAGKPEQDRQTDTQWVQNGLIPCQAQPLQKHSGRDVSTLVWSPWSKLSAQPCPHALEMDQLEVKGWGEGDWGLVALRSIHLAGSSFRPCNYTHSCLSL